MNSTWEAELETVWSFLRDFENDLGGRDSGARLGVRQPTLDALRTALLAPRSSPMLDGIFERLVGMLLEDRDAAIVRERVRSAVRWGDFMDDEDGALDPFTSDSDSDAAADAAADSERRAALSGAMAAATAASEAASVAASEAESTCAAAAGDAAAADAAAAVLAATPRGRPKRSAAQRARKQLKARASEQLTIDVSLGIVPSKSKKTGKVAERQARRLEEASEEARRSSLRRRRALRDVETHTRIGKSANDNWDRCSVCFGAGELICCDGCPQALHARCADLRATPDGRWLCPSCSLCGAAYFADAAVDPTPVAAPALACAHRSVVHILTRREPTLGSTRAAFLSTRSPLLSKLSPGTWPALLRQLLCEKNSFDGNGVCLRLLNELDRSKREAERSRSRDSTEERAVAPLCAIAGEVSRATTAAILANELRCAEVLQLLLAAEGAEFYLEPVPLRGGESLFQVHAASSTKKGGAAGRGSSQRSGRGGGAADADEEGDDETDALKATRPLIAPLDLGIVRCKLINGMYGVPRGARVASSIRSGASASSSSASSTPRSSSARNSSASESETSEASDFDDDDDKNAVTAKKKKGSKIRAGSHVMVTGRDGVHCVVGITVAWVQVRPLNDKRKSAQFSARKFQLKVIPGGPVERRSSSKGRRSRGGAKAKATKPRTPRGVKSSAAKRWKKDNFPQQEPVLRRPLSAAQRGAAVSSSRSGKRRLHCNLHLDFIADVRRALAERSRYAKRGSAKRVGELGASLLAFFDSLVAAKLTFVKSRSQRRVDKNQFSSDQAALRFSWIGRRVLREVKRKRCVSRCVISFFSLSSLSLSFSHTHTLTLQENTPLTPPSSPCATPRLSRYIYSQILRHRRSI